MREYQKTCGQFVDKYDGHVPQYLGDGLMTYFDRPRTHEDDADRGIRAALEIAEGVKKIESPEPVVVGETGAHDTTASWAINWADAILRDLSLRHFPLPGSRAYVSTYPRGPIRACRRIDLAGAELHAAGADL